MAAHKNFIHALRKAVIASAAAFAAAFLTISGCGIVAGAAVLPAPATEEGDLPDVLSENLPEPATAADSGSAAPNPYGGAAGAVKLPPPGTESTGELFHESGESEQKGVYRYSLPGGLGFESRVRGGEQAEGMVAIQIDDSPDMAWALYKDGESYDYHTGVTDPRSIMLIEDGAYELFVSDGVNTDKFAFTLANSGMSVGGELADALSDMMTASSSVGNADTVLDMQYSEGLYRFTFPDVGKTADTSDEAGMADAAEALGELDMTAKNMGVTSNLPVGAITNGTLTITADSGINVSAYHNGEEFDWNSGDVLSEDGVYNFRLSPFFSVQTGTDSRGNSVRTNLSSVISFRVITKPTAVLDSVIAPAGFSIDRVYRRDAQGESEIQTDGRQLFIDGDGYYVFQFRAVFSTDTDFSASVLRDTAPPELALPAEVLSGQPYKGKITLNVKPTPSYAAAGKFINGDDIVESDGADNVAIEVVKDTRYVNPQNNTLVSPGTYTVTVTDSAGNQNTYVVEISGVKPQNFDIPILILSALAVPALWLFIHRKERMRVI